MKSAYSGEDCHQFYKVDGPIAPNLDPEVRTKSWPFWIQIRRFCHVVYSTTRVCSSVSTTMVCDPLLLCIGKCAHRTPAGVRGSATHVLASIKVKKFYMITPFSQLNLGSVEHVRVD
jgi:hypothetical protein